MGLTFGLLGMSGLSGLALLGLLLFGIPLHHADPRVNLAIHAAVVALPLTTGLMMGVQPIHYKVAPGETVLSREIYLCALFRHGWHLASLWPSLILATLVLVQAAIELAAHPAGGEPVPAGSAILTFLMSLTGGLFVTSLLFCAEEIRCDDEGIRIGTAHFAAWEQVRSVTRTSSALHVFHKTAPDLPVISIPLPSATATGAFEQHLAHHQIPVWSKAPPRVFAIKAASFITALAILLAGLALRQMTSLDGRGVILMVFSAGIVLGLLLERARGLRHLTRIRPAVKDKLT